MSENIFKKSFKKNVSKLFSIFKRNISNDNNNDKGKSIIKDGVGKHDIFIYLPTTSLRIF